MRASVSILLKSHASPDMLPFSLCNRKRLAIQHMTRPLFPMTLFSVLQHREVGQAKDLSAPPCSMWPLTYSMEQSPSWEANRFSASQVIPRILWNLKVHYHIHRFPATCPYPVTSPIQSIPPHPISWRSTLILSFHLSLGLPSGLFHSGFPTSSPIPHKHYMPHPSHSSQFYHPNNIGCRVQIIKLLIM